MKKMIAELAAATALITASAAPATAGVAWKVKPAQQTCVTNADELYPVTSPDGGNYFFTQDGYNWGAGTEGSCYDSTTFNVSASTLDSTGGVPAAYTNMDRCSGTYFGNACTVDSGLPIAESGFTDASAPVHLTMSGTLPTNGDDRYDLSFDLFFLARHAQISNSTDHREMMIWLTNTNGQQPVGSLAYPDVTIGSHTFNVWLGSPSSGDTTITFVDTTQVTTLSSLNLSPFVTYANSLGYVLSTDYLKYIGGGFEIWQDCVGAGATVKITTPAGS